MEQQRLELQAQIEALEKAARDLRERAEDCAMQDLCKALIQEQNQAAPTVEPPAREREAAALLALQLLRLQAEMALLQEEPDGPWRNATACIHEIMDLTAQVGCFFRMDRRSIAVAGRLMAAACRKQGALEQMLQCMPRRYLLVLQTEMENEEAGEQDQESALEILQELCFACADWDLPEQGAQLLELYTAELRDIFEDADAQTFLLQLLFRSIDHGGNAMAAAYGDAVASVVDEEWTTINRGDFYWMYGFALYNTHRYGEAQTAFYRCEKWRELLFGRTDLLTLFPKAYAWFIRLFVLCRDYDEAGTAFLTEFLKDVLEHRYDQLPWPQQLQIVGLPVYHTLARLSRMEKSEGLDDLLALYRQACDTYDTDPAQPYFRKRYAYGLTGIVEAARHNYHQALEQTLRALETAIPANCAVGSGEEVLDEATLEYNAAYLCYIIGAVPEGMQRLERLLDRLEEDGERNEEIYLRALSVYLSYSTLLGEPDEEEAAALQEFLHEEAQKFAAGDPSLPQEESGLEALACGAVVERLCCNGCLRPQDFADAEQVLRAGLKETKNNVLYKPAYVSTLYLLMVVLWLRDDPDCLALAEEFTRQEREAALQDRVRASGNMFVTIVRKQFCGAQAAVPYARAQLQDLTEQWKNSVGVLDDLSLSMTMFNARSVFSNAYCILRQEQDVKQDFELLLQGKALASLAARERNRILLTLQGKPEQAMLQELRELQNRRAVLYTLPDTDEAAEQQMQQLEREIARLSAQVEMAMPQLRRFTPVTADAVADKLPENSAVLEYYWAFETSRETVWQSDDEKKGRYFDVYVVRRQDGRVTWERRALAQCDMRQLSHDCEAFRRCCDDADTYADREARARKNALRKKLYETLFRPIEDLLDGVQTLYIAPEELLRNLPYGLLGPDAGHTLEDRYTVIEMICSRDLLFGAAGQPLGGACAVGDPAYRANSRRQDREEEQDRARSGKELYRLPFSRTEAEMVARTMGGRCLTGTQASKQTVQQLAGRYGILHIAAHSDFKQEEDVCALFSARIYLAGAQTFLDTETEDPAYGNGILTADEISRMDLHGTWLAVLSACFTGMDEATNAGSLQGLVSAFAAAGVRYVVTSLWEADDFSTAELMRRFYQLLREGRPAPAALREAKRTLAAATVAELKTVGWDALRHDPRTPDSMRAMLQLRLDRGETFRPFADEHYWGGFVCHCCG